MSITREADAREMAANYRRGWSLRSIGIAYGVSRATAHRLVRSTGTPMRAPGQTVTPMLAPALPDPVVNYGDRFAYAGRCGECLGQHADGAPCEPVRVTSLVG